jgi:Zn-dependent M28 family amino/carboxypeptidase
MKGSILKFVLVNCLGICAWAQGSPSAAEQAAMKQIRPEAIRAHMRFLSDSLLQGRAPGTPGYQIAARYVATQLEAAGLRPAGVDGTWYQTVPLRKSVTDDGKSSMVLVTKGGEQTLVSLKDYVLYGDLNRTDTSVEAPVVFVGFGVTATERNYDDYAGADVKGKIVAALDGAPAKFPSTVRAYYSDFNVKAKNAVAHGAVGWIGLELPEDQKRNPWDWNVPQIQMGNMEWLERNDSPHNAFPELRNWAVLNQSGTDKLFAGASKTLDQLFEAARASRPQSLALPVTARIHSISSHTSADSPNIIGEVIGSDPQLRNQYVVYTAHVDHLGICPPVNGDNVCHGALDNASGVASQLEIARAFASLPKAPRRSILFVFVTGEEMGLLGSDYFANSPTVPRSAIAANINIDGAPGLFYPMKDLIVLGIEHSSLEQQVQSAAKQIGYSLSPDPMPEENFFIRSDQYSFVQQGIPAVNITDGMQSADAKVDGMKLQKEWLVTKYHTPLDNMDQALDYASGAKAAGVNFLVGYDVAQQDAAPSWDKGDFFGDKFGPRHAGDGSRAGK